MSDTANKSEAAEPKEKKSKKGLIITILVAIIAIGGGAGGAWFFMKGQSGTSAPEEVEKKPTTFTELDIFTVNLQPEGEDQYLQVGLTVKIVESEVKEAIKKQMPEIRNRILLLLSNKQATDISSKDGKQQLSQEITNEIKQSLDSEVMQEDIIDVLFTSFVIQ